MKPCLLPILTTALALSGCAPKQPDMSPIGAGLSVIGLGIVIGCLIIALFLRGGGHDE